MISAGNAVPMEELARDAGSSLMSDAADQLGLGDTTADRRLVHVDGAAVIVGWARTAHVVEVDAPEDPPYDGAITFIDSLVAGDVAVVGGPTSRAACWGELFSTAALARGARGAVLDGLHRDTLGIARLGFPVVSRGARPADMSGRVALVDHDSAVDVVGITVHPGDLVVADADGLTCIPRSHSVAVARAALEKARTESRARDLLRSGALLREAWEAHRVL